MIGKRNEGPDVKRRILENTEVTNQGDPNAFLFFIAIMLLLILLSIVLRKLGVDTDWLDRVARGRERF